MTVDDSEPLCREPSDDTAAPDGAPPGVVSILAVPGLERQSPGFIRALAELAVRNGWDPSGIAAVISHESGFRPNAKASNSTATGLIQFIEATAHALGTTTAALAVMSAIEQLPFVERYFKRFMPKVPSTPEDYLLVTYGRPDAIGEPDDFALDRRDSDDPHERLRYSVNKGLDASGAGVITAGDLRESLATVLRAAHGRYVSTSLGSSGGGGALVALVILGPPILESLRRLFR
jgi:hypothetical protein